MINSLSQIREKFTDFFVKNDHQLVASSSLIPHNDPSLMFVNSGMVQFKNIFIGQETRSYKTAVSSQKSVRAGGKHNDLDNVGYTARHHTFFEMLGNFSFGDYFKEAVIKYAWDLLTKEFCLPKEKLLVTVYHTDDESTRLWKKIAGLQDEKIIKINTTDNFWSMSETGPCGPCSEIFYDHGSHISGGPPGTPDQDGDRFIEIWNLVFMEFEQIDKDTRIPLPTKSIDTGMGLERITAIMQGVHDNYDTDLFRELIYYLEHLFEVSNRGQAKFSYRVIADHIRAIAFLIADGIMPSNEGRGYVLRRIMRRAMRHTNLLGSQEPIIYKLLPKLIELMGSAYPELKRSEEFISNILQQEEIRFHTTLERGLKLLDEELLEIPRGGILKGDVAFKLYDTYGFPLDLTEDVLKTKEIKIDLVEFENKMQEQKQKARKSWVGSGANKQDEIWFKIKTEFGATEFLGYALDDIEAKVLALIHNNLRVDCIQNTTEQFILITNQTPFYGESGGQLGDIGVIESASCKIKVVNTLKYQGNIHAHICVLTKGQIAVSDNIHMKIDAEYRRTLRAHHSATHILHAALRNILGKHVAQKGSLVAHNYLRFDFSHPQGLSDKELELIEQQINQIILANLKVNTTLMSTSEAIKQGAMALFGEKYDDEVRVVTIENQDSLSNLKTSYSFELCGGTHVKRTGDIGSFKITSEHAIAAGIRRIEAICGEFVLRYAKEDEKLLHQISLELKATKAEIMDKINDLMTHNKQLEKALLTLKLAKLEFTQSEIDHSSLNTEDYRLIYKLVEDFDIKTLRLATQQLIDKHDQLIVIYISKVEGKLLIVVGVNKKLKNNFSAKVLIEKISNFIGGSGGGSDLLAQGHGTLINKLPVLIDQIHTVITST